MDTVTHALVGATLAHAAGGTAVSLSARERLALGAAAAAFPDIDFVAFALDPLRFLADWHQGPTHSLLLAPLWAALLAAGFVAACASSARRRCFAAAWAVALLAIVSHIATDLITAYGTALWWPLSMHRYSLDTTFVIDPLLTAIVATGLAWNIAGAGPRVAWLALALFAATVAVEATFRQRALELGVTAVRAAGLPEGRLVALPQPLSPLNWKLIHTAGDVHYEAYVNLAGHGPWVPAWPGLHTLHALASAYVPPQHIAWRARHRLGELRERRALAEELWRDARFAPFRRFATHPAVSRIDAEDATLCVWFTDLRYDLPVLPETFRFGFCRDGADAPWRLYRLRYLRDDARQALDR